MSAHEKRLRFPKYLAKLLTYADERGIDLQVGEVYRPPETARLYAAQGRGISRSLHCEKLAVDLLVFRGTDYVEDGDADEYVILGEFWKGLDPMCSWGGDFTRKDPGHFSIAHEGRE